MTNTQKNTAGESWEKDFDREFRFRSDELAKDGNYQGTELSNELKAFIHKTRQEAIAGERLRTKEVIDSLHFHLLHNLKNSNFPKGGPRTESESSELEKAISDLWAMMKPQLLTALTPTPNTSKEPICGDCLQKVIEDGENCIAGGTHDFPKY